MSGIFDRLLSTDTKKPRDTSGENDQTGYTIISKDTPTTGDENMAVPEDEIMPGTTSTDPEDLNQQVADQYEMRRRGRVGPKPRRPRPRPKI